MTLSGPSTLYGSAAPVRDARERMVRTAYDLFCRYGIAAVGVDRIIAEAGVAKTTLYRHFRSKDDLVLAVVERRDQLWTREWLRPEVERRCRTPRQRLLAIFDVLGEWFRQKDFESCFVVASLLESRGPGTPVGAASAAAIGAARAFVRELVACARIDDPDDFAWQWQMLMIGAIVAATAGDPEAARRARDAGSVLLQAQAPPLGAGGRTP